MGLLDLIAPGNPVSPWFDQNRGKITGAFGGLVGSGNDPRAALTGWTQGLQHGVSVDQENAIIRQQQEQQQATLQAEQDKQNKTIAWLQQNAPKYADAVANGAMTATDAWKAALTDANPKAGSASYGQTPVFLIDAQGNQHAAQMSSAGGLFIDGKTVPGIPNGWKVVARPDNLSTVDLGGSRAVFNPNTGQWTQGPAIQGAPSANMDVSLNPDGTRTMAPAAGSPQAATVRGDQTKAKLTLDTLDQKQGLVAQNIDKAIQMASSVPSTGPFSIFSAIPGTPQYDLKATLDTIKANVGFDQLQQMRDNSPTGGALGQVSERENTLLQSVLGSLDQAQSKEQFIANLNALKQILSESSDARRRAYAQDFGGGSSLPPTATGGNTTFTYNPATGQLE